MWTPRWLKRLRQRRVDRDALAAGSPWVRVPMAPPLPAFGPGADRDFITYLTGDSQVSARTPPEIARWLIGCRYADDQTLLGEHDLWQHPRTFEVLRCGDCEDFSLWAWRKLVDASMDADFVVGLRLVPEGRTGRHAWVLYRDSGIEFLFDPVERTLDRMIRPRMDAAHEYEPQVGVDARGVRFAFAGLYRTEWGSRLALEPHESD